MAAITVIMVAGLLYLLENPSQPVPVPIRPQEPAMLAGYSVAYDFINPSLGWALMEAQPPLFWVFRTTDAAKTWKRLYTGIATPGPLSLHFFDGTHGVLAVQSNDSVVMRTGDGGVRWQPVALPGLAVWIAFADPSHGWILGADDPQKRTVHLLATTDGGATWIQMTWPSTATLFGKQSRFDIPFRTGGEGWLGASDTEPTVFLTLDGGYNWRSRVIDLPNAFPAPGLDRHLSYTTEVTLLPHAGVVAFVTDNSGNVRAFTSFDRGQSWRLITSPPDPARFTDLAFVDAKHWWAMNSGFLFKTSDAGQSWGEVHGPPLIRNWNYLPLNVIDSKHAWSEMVFTLSVSIPDTSLAMTSDGGATWQNVNVPVNL